MGMLKVDIYLWEVVIGLYVCTPLSFSYTVPI